MDVFALVGPSGSGKSSIVDFLYGRGIMTMAEEYMESFPSEFSNKELLSKWFWIAQWLECLWNNKLKGNKLLVTDRCPLEVVPYATHGEFLLEPLKHTMKELEKHGVFIRTLYLRVPLEICFERSQTRFRLEPYRQAYGEGDLGYVASVYQFYENGIGNLWNFTIEASQKSIEELATEVTKLIERSLNSEP
ncbi:MAG: hypothetical protein MUO85_03920 [candidate division Zixibacteria bacterium]|nr:hypothetical protein [candidate division Zixibacteria bacterium]